VLVYQDEVMTTMRRVTAWLSAAALAVVLGCCGGSSTPTTPTATPTPTPAPTPTPTPLPANTIVVIHGSGASAPAGYIAWVPFTIGIAGDLDVTVDWVYATDDIDIYLTQGSCDSTTINTTACPILTYSESTTAKPEVLHLANAAPGTYTLFVNNLGPLDEAVSYQVLLTKSATGATNPTASSRAGEGSAGWHSAPAPSAGKLRSLR
jgi:hypothetical protein